MLVKELRETLEEYDGEMEVVILDVERDSYEILGMTIDNRKRESRLVLISG